MQPNYSLIARLVENHSKVAIEKGKALDWTVTKLPNWYIHSLKKVLNSEYCLWKGNPDNFKIAACIVASLVE